MAVLLMLYRASHKWRRNLCEEHCFVECSRALEVRNSGKNKTERSEGEGDCRLQGEGAQERKGGRERH